MAKQYRQHRFTVPDGMCDMLLIRHGESMPYVEGVPHPQKDGQSDPHLHPMGHKQAVAVGERLKNTHFDALYVTTLTRTHQTAAPLAKALGMTPMVEKDLREIYLGEWDSGLFRIKMEERDPLYLKAIEQQEWGLVPGAESSAELQDRVKAGLLRIAAKHPNQHVAVFVHGGVIGAAMAVATGSRSFAFIGAENGSISRLAVGADRMIVRTFNDTSHLQHLVDEDEN